MEKFDFQRVIEGATALVSNWGLSVVGALVVLVLGWLVARAVRRAVGRALERSGLDKTLVPFLKGMAYYTILAFVFIAVLRLFGIPTTSFIAVLGAAGLAVGLALQGTLSNFAAGVMMLLFRPFAVGDYVEAGGDEGVVREVGIFSSSFDTLDNVRVVLPNSAIWGQKIRNYTCNPARRNDMTIGISYSDDIARAKAIVHQVLRADPRVLAGPEPLVAVQDLGSSSVDLLVAPWCEPEHYWDLRFDLFQTIKEKLEAGGCSIPFPQRDVHLFPEEAGSSEA